MTDFKTASGKKFPIQLSDPVIWQHFNNGASMTEELIHQINAASMYDKYFIGHSDLTFLDLGANIGLVSIYASDVCRRIVAVEPAPATFNVLCKMVAPLNKVETIQAAITPVDGESIFHVNDVNSTASSTVNTYGTQIRVRGMTLSTLLRERNLSRVDFCKVDIEGAEGESLTAAEINNNKDIIRSYFIETHNCPKTTWEHKMGTVVGNMARAGYYKMEIDGMGIYVHR